MQGKAPDIEPPTEYTVLANGFKALEQEIERIKGLLANDDPMLARYLGKIKDLVVARIGEAEEKIADGRAKLQANMTEAWRDYGGLKTKVMPSLARDLLAVIGGAYLQDRKLDSMPASKRPRGSVSPSEPSRALAPDEAGDTNTQHRRLSFSEQSQGLVEELAEMSKFGWQSVLIVGEEYFGPSDAEIIRLHFPACDIWNLPFTAHEYGYFVATSARRVPHAFRDFRDQKRLLVHPAGEKRHTIGSQPEDKACFIGEVQDLWDRWHGAVSDEKRAAIIKAEAQRLCALASQQESYICRLFADAFATFFVGPAYVHALLNLRFTANILDESSPYFPPFAPRFVLCMETLKWMDGRLKTRPDAQGPFQREIFDDAAGSAGLLGFWRCALKSIGIEKDPYVEILTRYQPWFDKIAQTIRLRAVALDAVHANWLTAQKLEQRLTETTLSVPFVPAKWAVLNAAWSARWLYPSREPWIEANALRLLDPEDRTWLQPDARSQDSLSSETKGTDTSRAVASNGGGNLPGSLGQDRLATRDETVGLVLETLIALGVDKLVEKFGAAAEAGSYRKDHEIIRALSRKPLVLRQYLQFAEDAQAPTGSGR